MGMAGGSVAVLTKVKVVALSAMKSTSLNRLHLAAVAGIVFVHLKR